MTIGIEHDRGDLSREEQQWQERLSPERIGRLSEQFLAEGVGQDLRQLAGGRQFVVGYIDANSPYADIARSVEYSVFTKWFNQDSAYPFVDHDKDYGKYDPVSTFATVIDISEPQPRGAGVLRICGYDPAIGLKDVNDLLADDESNPWLDEIVRNYFEDGEQYSPKAAWSRLGERAIGREIALIDSLDIATHATAEGYGSHGSVDGVSMLFYHACLRFAQAHGVKNLLAIFDLKPFENLQQWGEPFDTYEGLNPHPYGGPGDTIPAYCVIDDGLKRVREFDEGASQVFGEGLGLDAYGLLPNEYQPDTYSNRAIGIE